MTETISFKAFRMTGKSKFSLYDLMFTDCDLSVADSRAKSEQERGVDMTLELATVGNKSYADNKKFYLSKIGYDFIRKILRSNCSHFTYSELLKLAGGEKYFAVGMQSVNNLGIPHREHGHAHTFDGFGVLDTFEPCDYYSSYNKEAASKMPDGA